MTRNRLPWFACLLASAIGSGQAFAAENPLAVAIDADTMIALDTNTTGSGGTGGAFGNGVEAANPHGGLSVMHIRGGNAFDESSITAKPLIRFDLGPTAGVSIDPSLPYFLETTTETNASSNDTFRIYSITDAATRSFNEGTITWNNAPAVATQALQDYNDAGTEVGIFFRPNSIDDTGSSIGHPLMGSAISTFTSGGNTFATFGLTSTETNRWRITSKEFGGGGFGSRLYTFDVVESNASGSLTSGGTWSGAANQAETLYRVGGGNTVTIDGAVAFAGVGVVAGSGGGSASSADFNGDGSVNGLDINQWEGDFGVNGDSDADSDGDSDIADILALQRDFGSSGTVSTVSFTANNVDVPLIVINSDGQISNDTGTSLSIGSPTPSRDEVHAGAASLPPGSPATTGGLIINRNLTYSAAVGEEDLTINVPLISYNDFTFNGVAGSDLRMRFPAGHRGTINFNGAGDEVVISEDEGIGGTLVMNATGSNTLAFEGRDSEQEFDNGTVVFNQAGALDHRSDDDRLQGIGNLVANAPVTVDLSATFPTAGPQSNERFFRVTRNVSGSAAITVQGTASAPSGTGNTENSFSIGVDAADFTDVREVDYSGTITTQDYVQFEARAGMPNARIVVNPNGVLATGFETHAKVPHHIASTTEFGEIELVAESSNGAGDGGELNVGFLVATTGDGDHSPQNLRLTTSGGQNGNLTMANGTSLVMQINGDPDHVPPQPGDPGNCSSPLESSCQYDGPVFDTIEVEGVATLDGELVVRLNADVPFQVEPSGTPPQDPDYFPLSVGDTWDIITGVNGGTITGTFDTITVIDTLNDLLPSETFEVLYTSSTLVQLRLVNNAPVTAVPEPASGVLALAMLFGIGRRNAR